MKVLILGGASYDTLFYFDQLPEPKAQTIFPKKTVKAIGSTGIGKAIPLKKIGFDVTLHAVIGNDNEGEIIKTDLKNQGINFIYDVDMLGTKSFTNLLDNDGRRISIYANGGTFEPIINEDKIRKEIDDADIVFVNIINYTKRFLPYIKALNKPIWIDLHDYDPNNSYYDLYCKYADVIQMSKEKDLDYKKIIKDFTMQKKTVILTDGKNGAQLFINDKEYQQDAIKPNQMVDVNGAGDHFFSGYFYGVAKKLKVEKALKAGALLATKCIESEFISNDLINEKWLIQMLD